MFRAFVAFRAFGVFRAGFQGFWDLLRAFGLRGSGPVLRVLRA